MELLALAVIAFVGGAIVTSVGPGGVFVVTALYALTPLTNAEIAGTSSATFAAGSVLGTAAYARSDHLRPRMAVTLGAAALAGTRVGVRANGLLSRRLFGLVLAGVLVTVGCAVLIRERQELDPVGRVNADTAGGLAALVAIGAGIGFLGGLLGIGGAALSMPALVLAGVPMLTALAVTQVLVVFVAAFTAINYALAGAVAVPLVFVIGAAYLAGTAAGWVLARRFEPGRLRVALGVALIGLAPVLVL